MVQESIPRRGALRGVPAEEPHLQGFDNRKITDMSAGIRDGVASGDQQVSKPGYEVCSSLNLLAGTNELTSKAEREGIIERHTHHRVRTFPLAHDAVEDLALFPWERCQPVLRNLTSRGDRSTLAL